MKVALMLSGGMGKGAYQVGALKSISKYVKAEDVSVVSATSIGTHNGYMFCINKVDELEKLWLEASTNQAKGFISKLINSQFAKDVIKDIASVKIEGQKFYTTLLSTTLKKRQIEYYNLTEEKDLLRREQILHASIRVPFLGRPIKLDGKHYYDGATAEVNPIKPVLDKDFDYAIAIYFNRNVKVYDQAEQLRGKVIKLCFDDGTFVKHAMVLNEESTKKMIKKGEEVTDIVLKEVFKNGVDNVEAVLKNIAEINELAISGKKHSLSSSHMADLLNKITKLFVSKKDK